MLPGNRTKGRRARVHVHDLLFCLAWGRHAVDSAQPAEPREVKLQVLLKQLSAILDRLCIDGFRQLCHCMQRMKDMYGEQ